MPLQAIYTRPSSVASVLRRTPSAERVEACESFRLETEHYEFTFRTTIIPETRVNLLDTDRKNENIFRAQAVAEIGLIAPEFHGHFAEHLGSCVYGGLWVGKKSSVPNIDGYRKQAIDYLKELGVPVLRWPGGCFADDYHWRDGIGPAEQRPKRVNIHWGGYVEDGSFGTHEFIGLCRLLG